MSSINTAAMPELAVFAKHLTHGRQHGLDRDVGGAAVRDRSSELSGVEGPSVSPFSSFLSFMSECVWVAG